MQPHLIAHNTHQLIKKTNVLGFALERILKNNNRVFQEFTDVDSRDNKPEQCLRVKLSYVFIYIFYI